MTNLHDWMIWPDNTALSVLVLVLVAMIGLYAARAPMHGIIRAAGYALSGALRLAARWLFAAAAQMKERTARHVCSNLRLVADGPDRVNGSLTITLFRHDGPGMGTADPVAAQEGCAIIGRSRAGVVEGVARRDLEHGSTVLPARHCGEV